MLNFRKRNEPVYMKKILIGTIFVYLSIFAPSSITFHPTTAAVVYAEKVAFNQKTHKVHKLYCTYASKCTVNCIIIERKDAYKRGGVPCKVCGG